MPLLKGGTIEDDAFLDLEDGASFPEGASVIVSWDRLRQDYAHLAAYAGRLGVRFPVDADPAALSPFVSGLQVIALEFAAYTDGRAYSLARVIRSQLGFTGELRATGDVLADQVAFMRQVGFDSFEIRSDRQPLDVWQRTATAMSLTYQTDFVARQGFAPAEILNKRRHAGA
jgi:uncharacterized protein (DUF934 family)